MYYNPSTHTHTHFNLWPHSQLGCKIFVAWLLFFFHLILFLFSVAWNIVLCWAKRSSRSTALSMCIFCKGCFVHGGCFGHPLAALLLIMRLVLCYTFFTLLFLIWRRLPIEQTARKPTARAQRPIHARNSHLNVLLCVCVPVCVSVHVCACLCSCQVLRGLSLSSPESA